MTEEHYHHQMETDAPRAIGNPARRGLADAGYTRLKQLTAVTGAKIGQLHGIGPKAFRAPTAALTARGPSFAHADHQ